MEGNAQPDSLLTSAAALGPRGPLAGYLDGFRHRPQQREMAEAVARALAFNDTLITEAGTGTGKTFAYLVPALLSGRRIIISTGTKNLQDQLFYRDLPLVRGALGIQVNAALLKGRANYVCLYRLNRLNEAQPVFLSRRQSADLRRVQAWSRRTRSGDIGELDGLAEDSPLWPQMTSTTDNCLKQSCPSYSDCFIVKARRAAQQADVVVVNHHLLFADLALKEDGFGEVLPGSDAFILDEAHLVPDTAGQFFGLNLGSRQLFELARDSRVEGMRDAGDMAALRDAADAVEKGARDLLLALDGPPRRMTWREAEAAAGVTDAVESVRESLTALNRQLEAAAARGKGLENCWRRGLELGARLDELIEPQTSGAVHWIEIGRSSFKLCLTPLDIAGHFCNYLNQYRAAWIFTSATLAVGDDFQHFASRLGIESAVKRRWDSPFDFQRNTLLYLPETLPSPDDRDYTRAVIEAAIPVMEASRGRTFLLFTSHRALQQAADLLSGRLEYPLLVQGTMSRARLLEAFRSAGNAVLLGTYSFWEGVDVRGPALSCVIIDKLPFASPDDPILRARIAALRVRGENAFGGYQLPAAVITLKQGIGRLIRDDGDKGLVMLCDPRLLTRPYGKVFLDSLPPMPRTRSLSEAARFLSDL